MNLDAHQHFWKYNPHDYEWISDAMPDLKKDFLPYDLAPLLQAKGFDGCIAVQARQTEKETDFLLELADNYDIIKAVIGWVDLQSAHLEARLQYYRQFPVLKGFRHIVQDEPDDQFLLRKPFMDGIQSLGKLGFTYDILVYEKHLPIVLEFLKYFDNQLFVIDHIGKPNIKKPMNQRWKDMIYALAQYPNLYCKISGMVTEAPWQRWTLDNFKPYLEVVFDAFGMERIMIGSDWPVCLLAAQNYSSVIEIVEDFTKEFSESEKRQIFGENAARFYGIGIA
ncbi:MAG: amidohydrolase family protein [Saprospiraceae bacterium]|nr:amidohydrolase family protein [Saprospiraceae bacterium]